MKPLICPVWLQIVIESHGGRFIDINLLVLLSRTAITEWSDDFRKTDVGTDGPLQLWM